MLYGCYLLPATLIKFLFSNFFTSKCLFQNCIDRAADICFLPLARFPFSWKCCDNQLCDVMLARKNYQEASVMREILHISAEHHISSHPPCLIVVIKQEVYCSLVALFDVENYL